MSKLKFGTKQLKHETPRRVTVVCDCIHAIGTAVAGYGAFSGHPLVPFSLMIVSIIIERGVKPFFGIEPGFKDRV